jgi:hypothetical protein
MILAGVVVSCVLVFGVGAVQMVPPTQDKPAQQVEVINFPAVQQVAGSVQVSNLPVDADGNVRISGNLTLVPPAIRFIGLSGPVTNHPNGNVLDLNRDCVAALAGTRACHVSEVLNAIPPPGRWDSVPGGVVWVVHDINGLGQLDSDGNFSQYATFADGNPVACCGF